MLPCILQALNNYEGYDKYRQIGGPHTVGDFVNLFNEITNDTHILLKVIPAAMHLFIKEKWFDIINCSEDSSIFVIAGKHIYNYICHAGVWWKLDTTAGICEEMNPLQLGVGASYCLIPVRRLCIGGFLERLMAWRPVDMFYKTVQAGLVVRLYEESKKHEEGLKMENEEDVVMEERAIIEEGAAVEEGAVVEEVQTP